MSTIVAVGQGSINNICKSVDGGATWTAVPSPLDDYVVGTCGHRIAYGGGSFVATGEYSFDDGTGGLYGATAVVSTDGGATWTPAFASGSTYSSVVWMDVQYGGGAFMLTGLGFSGGVDFILMSTDGGATWAPPANFATMAASTDGLLKAHTSVYRSVDSTWWFGGINGRTGAGQPKPVLWSWNGSTWTFLQEFGNPPASAPTLCRFESIAWADALLGVISISQVPTSTGVPYFVTTDGGATWTEIAAGASAPNGVRVAFLNGTFVSSFPGLSTSTDGVTWTAFLANVLDVFWDGSMWLAAAYADFVGTAAASFYSGSSPGTLVASNAPLSNNDRFLVFFYGFSIFRAGSVASDGTNIVMIGNCGNCQPPSRAVIRSTDGGATWADVSPIFRPATSYSPNVSQVAVHGSTIVVAGFSSGGGFGSPAPTTWADLMTSTDGGATWAETILNLGLERNDNIGHAVGGLKWNGTVFGLVTLEGLFYTSPDGFTWTRVGDPVNNGIFSGPGWGFSITGQNNGLDWRNATWLVAGYDINGGCIAESPDGVTWSFADVAPRQIAAVF